MAGMRYTLVVYQNGGKEVRSSIECLLKNLQENGQLSKTQEGQRCTGGIGCEMVSLCPVNQDFEVTDVDMAGQWTALDTLDIENLPVGVDTATKENESQSPRDITFLADLLHDVADNLPYTGFILDVYLINLNMEHENSVLFVGSMLRLREWHKAQVKVVGAVVMRHEEITLTLCDVIQAIFFSHDQLQAASAAIHHWPIWRGDLVWPGEKGFTQQGLSLVCSDQESLKSKLVDLHFWNRRSVKKEDRSGGSNADLVIGRQLEVLTYVNVETLPVYLIDDFSLQLHMTPHPAQSQFGQLVGTLNHKDALVLRIALYEKFAVPVASSHGLSSEAWRESFAASELPTHEPAEKGSLPCRQHLFLMVRGNQDVSRPLEAAVMLSPSEVDKGLFEELHYQIYFGYSHGYQGQSDTELDRVICETLQQLPFVTAEDFLTTNDACMQSLVQCVRKLKSSVDDDGPVTLTTAQLLPCVQEGHEALFQLGKKQIAMTAHERKASANCFGCICDVECEAMLWPERKELLDSESRAKVLRRYQSNESFNLMLSSPLVPEDSSMDAKDIVRWFKPDGNAVHDDLSPVKPPVCSSRLSNYDEAIMEWPACKDLQFHDVYYEHNKKSKRREQFFQKFRDTILLEESLHVCSEKPSVPALRYRNHSRLRHNQMDVSCGGSKLTPITRTSLSPSSMLQATPSAKRCLSRESDASLSSEGNKSRSKGSEAQFSAPKSRIGKDRNLSFESGHSGREIQSLESSSERHPVKERCSFESTLEGLFRKERRLLESSFEEHCKEPSLDKSCMGHSSQAGSSGSVFYPKMANPTLPPFRRKSKEGLTIFSPSSHTMSLAASDELLESAGNGFRRKMSSLTFSSEDGGSDQRMSSESMDSMASQTDKERRQLRQKRNEKNKRKLEKVVTEVLEGAGVGPKDILYPSCFAKLYKVSLFYAKQLPDSHNLQAELRSITEKQVQQVVDLERRRQDLAVMKKLRKSTLVG